MPESTVSVLWVGDRRDLPPDLQVTVCDNPAWIVEAVERDAPDLIVVDLAFRALQGVEVITDLGKSELTRIVPLVVLSRDEGLDWRAELFRAGASDVIDDATTGAELHRRLRAVLGRRPWGGPALGPAGPGPAVATIAALQRDRASAIVEVTDTKRRGAVRLEQGGITAIAIAGFVGEEALNCLAGRRGWTATVRQVAGAPSGAAPEAQFAPGPVSEFTPVPSPLYEVLGPPHVLVAEDDDGARRLLEISLGRRGFRITTASTGASALEAARRTRPDVVLSDVMMPQGDGWWLLSWIREDFAVRETPFLLFTNKGVESHPLETLGIRPDAMVRKDPHVAGVVRLLESALERVRTLFLRVAGGEAGALEGTLERSGPLTVMRVLRAARRRGRLKLVAASGVSATLALREDLIVSAALKGPSPAEGLAALAHVVTLDWRAFRFEPDDDVAGAGALGPAVDLLREACARAGRFFERLRLHGFAPAGGIQSDPDGVDAYGRGAASLAAPALRALLRRQTPEQAARATGLEGEAVAAILLDMLRQGAVVLADLDADPAPPIPVPEDAEPPPGPDELAEAERRAAEAERRARAAEERARVVAEKAAAFEAQARQSATLAGKRAAEAIAEAERRMADLEQRVRDAEASRDAAARASEEAAARAQALAAERRRMEELEQALEEARAQAARFEAEASRTRVELDLAAATALDAREGRDALERSLRAMRERQAALVATLQVGRQGPAAERAGSGTATPDAGGATEEDLRNVEDALTRLTAELAAGETELEARRRETEVKEAKLAEADAVVAEGRKALQAIRTAVEARLEGLAPREEALAVRESELRATEARLQAEREAIEKMRAAAETEAERLQSSREGDRHTVGRLLAELERLRAIAVRAAREAETAEQATARIVADTAATRERGEALAAEVARSHAHYAELDRLYNEPTLIRPMPAPPVESPADADAEPLAHWGETPAGERPHEAPRRITSPPPAPEPLPAPLFDEPAPPEPGPPSSLRDVHDGTPLRRGTPPPTLAGPSSPMPLPVVRPASRRVRAHRPWRRALLLGAAGTALGAALGGAMWLALHFRDAGIAAGEADPLAGGGVVPPPAASAGPRAATAGPPMEDGGRGDDAEAITGKGPRAESTGRKKPPRRKPGPADGSAEGAEVSAGGRSAPSRADAAETASRAAALSLAEEGNRHLLRGDPAAAVTRFKAAAAADPSAPEPCRGLVFAHVARGERKAAESALACYFRLRPRAPDAAELRARVAAIR